ncbi:MAG: hypothetical protein JXA82_10470 [Sedimentisphaerales bacterium]|nr:hypothetical protein [Sedimentisphaerales bacterium]
MNSMDEKKLEALLRQADALLPVKSIPETNQLVSIAHRRLRRRQSLRRVGVVAAAACLFICTGLWSLHLQTNHEQQVVNLETQIHLLQQRTDSALRLVEETLAQIKEQDRARQRTSQIETISDPIEEITAQIDKTAFTMLYQADRLYRELRLQNDAVEAYQRLIELFPENRWARVARQRLEEIQQQEHKKTKGDLS